MSQPPELGVPVERPGAVTERARTFAKMDAGLGGLPEHAERPAVTVDELRAAGDLWLCEADDGGWLRRVLGETPATISMTASVS